jgi:protein-tyrosine phosphatase
LEQVVNDEKKGKVVEHCSAVANRSGLIVAAFMLREMLLLEAVRLLKSAKHGGYVLTDQVFQ